MNVRTLFLLGLTCAPMAAQDKPQTTAKTKQSPKPKAAAKADDGSDLQTIRELSREFEKAFNSRNAKAVAAHWTEDGDYIDESGQVFAGRDAIEKEYSQFFKNNDGIKLQVVIDSLRLLSDDAAIEDGHVMLDLVRPKTKVSSTEKSLLTDH